MPSDRTRTTDDLRQRYKAVVMQQGRVTLDRDFNALQEIVEGQLGLNALDEIGPCGTPNNGFAISTPTPAQAASFSAEFSISDFWDFVIGPGTMYVGGQRIELPPPASNQPPWSYFNQPDWINPPQPTFNEGSRSHLPNEYVYLHVYEQEVGAVEDSDLLDVALGGPDTTQRVRLMWRAIRLATDATDCATALTEAKAQWAANGFEFDPTTMRWLPQAQLQVSFTATQATSTPCDPIEQGGYLGAENQLIRLQISETAAGKPLLLWGYDDASFLYTISQTSDNSTILLNQLPVDAFHSPTPGQVVEVLRSSTILGTEPNSTGSTPIVRCVAETSGFVTSVKTYVNSSNTLTLSSPLPTSYLNDSHPQFLRIWQGQQPIVLSSQPITLLDPTTNTSPGIQVTITVPKGGPAGASLPMGAYWMIAVRPSTPQLVYPERFLTGPQPPDGPRQWACPIAVIEWAQDDFVSRPPASFRATAKINDCRQTFCNLVTLSKRGLSGCCSVSVKPSDAANLQTILDKAATGGQKVTICFSSGVYLLDAPLRLSTLHSGMVLESCGGDVTLQASSNADPTGFLDGLIVLVLAHAVTLKNLRVVPPSVPLQAALNLSGEFENLTTITSSPASLQNILGIRLFQCVGISIEGCLIELSPGANLPTVGFGIHLSGDCTGLTIKGCRITSTTPPTVTSTQPPVIDTLTAIGPTASFSPPTFAFSGAHTLFDLTLLSVSLPLSASVPVPGALAPEATNLPAGPVALFGIFATTVTQSARLGTVGELLSKLYPLSAAMDKGRIIDNEFFNLTMAVQCLAAFGTCHLRENRVNACFGGFRLEASDFTDPAVALPDTSVPPFNSAVTTALNVALEFKELNAGDLISGFLPLPVGMSLVEFETLSNQQSFPSPIFLTLSNNDVKVSIASVRETSGAAIILRLNRSLVSGQVISSSLVMDSNQISGTPFTTFTLPLALVFPGGPTALTGNVITSSGRDAAGLALFPPAGWTFSQQMAVTGNVLLGSTTLTNITRSDFTAAPMNTWVPFNSILG